MKQSTESIVWLQAGGRFHFDALARGLGQRGRLLHGMTARRHRVALPLVETRRALAWARAVHRYSPLEHVVSSSLIWDRRFDQSCASALRRTLAERNGAHILFHGFAAYSLESARVARDAGHPVVIDTGSAHIRHQEELVRRAYESEGLPPRKFPARWVEGQTLEYELADRILVPSAFAARSFAGAPLAAKVRINSYGTDLNRFTPKERYRGAGPLVVGFVGNVNPEKGVHLATKAASLLGDLVELRVAGRVPPGLGRWWSSRSGVVAEYHEQLTGSELTRFFQELDVLVSPSCQDGYSLVVLEAMACGTPCLVSSNNGAADAIDDGLNGRVVPSFDADALAEALTWFAESRERVANCGASAVATARSKTWDAYVDRVERVYDEIMRSG